MCIRDRSIASQNRLTLACTGAPVFGSVAGRSTVAVATRPVSAMLVVAVIVSEAPVANVGVVVSAVAVSYTHLDVYKRQGPVR